MREAIGTLCMLFGILGLTVAVVMLLDTVVSSVPERERKSPTAAYEKECVRLGGKPLWNGKAIECLREATP